MPICPLTGGNETTLDRNEFIRMCSLKKERPTSLMPVRCPECNGENPPPELTIKDLREEYTMAKTIAGKCDVCLQNKNVKKHHEYTVCSTCANIITSLKSNPENVFKLLKSEAPGLFATDSRELESLKATVQALNDVLEDAKRDLVEAKSEKEKLSKKLEKRMEEIADLQLRIYEMSAKQPDSLPWDLAGKVINGEITGLDWNMLNEIKEKILVGQVSQTSNSETISQ